MPKLKNKRKARLKSKVKRKRVSPLKLDPTRTVTLRRSFATVLRKKFARLRFELRKLLIEQDAFGLVERQPFSVNVFDFDELPREAQKAAFANMGDAVASQGGIGRALELVKDFNAIFNDKDLHKANLGSNELADKATLLIGSLEKLTSKELATVAEGLFKNGGAAYVKGRAKASAILNLKNAINRLTVSYAQTQFGRPDQEALDRVARRGLADNSMMERKPFSVNVFCPTGPGGGVDPSCSPSGSLGSDRARLEDAAAAQGYSSEDLEGLSGDDLKAAFGGAVKAAKSKVPTSSDLSAVVDKRGGIHLGELYERHSGVSKEDVNEAVMRFQEQNSEKYTFEFVSSRTEGEWSQEEWDALPRIGAGDNTFGYTVAALVSKSATDQQLRAVYTTRGKLDKELKFQRVRNVFCPTGPGGGVDPTCSPSGIGGIVPSMAETAAAITLERPRGKVAIVLEKLKSAGATAGAVEHYIKEGIASNLAKLPEPVQDALAGMVGAAFVGWTASQALAERVAIERGMSVEQAKTFRGALAATDILSFKPVSVGMASAGVDSALQLASWVIPPATGSYLLYSAAKNPIKTAKAAGKLVKETVVKIGRKLHGEGPLVTSNVSDDVGNAVADALERHGYDDWYFALLCAALDETDDVADAIAIADAAYNENPTPTENSLTTNDVWRFASTPEKVKAFQEWLRTQMGSLLIGKTNEELWKAYIEAGFKRGAGRAFDDTTRTERVLAQGAEKLDFFKGTKEQFLRQSFGQPVAVETVQLLAGRSFDDLEGVTSDMSLRMSRTLTDGLVQGKGPREIARDLDKEVDIGSNRALTIARTEIVRAHAEGQLTAMENLGVQEVGVAVEWITAGDERVCFPAWTMVETDNGPVPIQDIKPWMMVKTREGMKRVLAIGSREYSGEMATVNAGEFKVTATADHPIWTVERGWIKAGELSSSDTLQTSLDQFIKVDRISNFSLGDAANNPVGILKESIFSFVPQSVAMPICTVNLNSNSFFRNQEIDGIPTDLSLLDVCDSERIQRKANSFFNRCFAVGFSVASKAAKSLRSAARASSEFCSACVASLNNWRTPAFFGTIPPIVSSLFVEPALIKNFAACSTRNVFASLGDEPAFDCAVSVPFGSRFQDRKFLGAPNANLRGCFSAWGVIAFPRTILAGASSVSVDQFPTSQAWSRLAGFAKLCVTQMRAKPIFAVLLFCLGVSFEFLATLVACVTKACALRNSFGHSVTWMGAKSRSSPVFEKSESSLKTLTALDTCELKWHDCKLLSELGILYHRLHTIPITVYDIQVEDAAEFFANGILVHNCDLCSELEGVVLRIEEARGMLPRHPACRCAWVPANVGEDDKDQKDTHASISEAIRESQEMGGDTWGPGQDITESRPESILNEQPRPELSPHLVQFSNFLHDME